MNTKTVKTNKPLVYQRVITFSLFFFAVFCFSQPLFAQFRIGASVGSTGYIGDLNSTPFKRVKPAAGVLFHYDFTPNISLRAGYLKGKLEGGDKYSGSEFLKKNRNLSFQSNLSELSAGIEYSYFDLNRKRWSPYAFLGLASFSFDPYVKDSGKKVFLRPLATEGQGLVFYPDRVLYKTRLFAPVFALGGKYAVLQGLTVSAEVGWRKTGTDYLDDVSTTYVDSRAWEFSGFVGNTSKRLSYRGDEVVGGTPEFPDLGYPTPGTQRGNAKTKDWYYFTGFTISYNLDKIIYKAQPKKAYGCN